MPALKNAQHERFCQEYLIDFNGTQAAIRAGYAPKHARKQGSAILQRLDVSGRMKKLHGEALESKKTDIVAAVERVLEEVRRIAYCDLKDAINPIDGTLLPIDEIPEDVRRCIASFHCEEIWEGEKGQRVQIGVIKKVKFWDKSKGLDLLGRHFKMFTTKLEDEIGKSLEAILAASHEDQK